MNTLDQWEAEARATEKRYETGIFDEDDSDLINSHFKNAECRILALISLVRAYREAMEKKDEALGEEIHNRYQDDDTGYDDDNLVKVLAIQVDEAKILGEMSSTQGEVKK